MERDEEPSDIINPDYLCTICFRIFYQPITLKCSHSYCRVCLAALLRHPNNRQCPMCRDPLKEYSQVEYKVNKKLGAVVKKDYPKQFEERTKDHKDDEAIEKNKMYKKLKIGNKVEIAGKKSTPLGRHSDWKKWTLYVSGDGKDDISDLIDHVTIKLHPTFSPSKVKLETAPFKFSRVGWGTFEIGLTIKFKDETKRAPMDVSHHLSFNTETNGRERVYDIDFDKRNLIKA